MYIRNICVFHVLLGLLNYVSSDCTWNLNRDLPEKDPVFIKKVRNRYQLYQSISNQIELKSNHTLIADCTGNKNTISGTSTKNVQLYCLHETDVQIDNHIYNIKDISCTKNSAADVIKQNAELGKSNLSIGFTTNFGWMETFQVTYDFEQSVPIYTQHVIEGRSLKGSYTGNATRPSFKANGMSMNVSWSTVYTKNNQRAVLTSIVGQQTADKYLSQTFIARGHLSPDADFYFHSWQMSTYFYANAAPQWQSINGGNWVRVENAVRNKAKELQQNLRVTTGTQGVAALANDSGQEQELYLASKHNVPVPKYIWKVVCNKQNFCIGFVVWNNPFSYKDEGLCENLCSRSSNSAGWYVSSYDDVGKGKIICCEVKALKNVFSNIPTMVVDGVLRY